MTNRQPASPLRQLRVLFTSGTATGLTDRQLLERYMARRAKSSEAATAAEMAFAALVDRHGAMVWGVCRRVLGDVHEAEDAFQATFLVLVRKAGSVRVEDSLGRWLYGVAHRVALRARSGAERRASYLGPTPAGSSDDPAGEVELRELRNALGEEVDRLPTKYRCPIELCDLQGMTYDQASRQLDWSVATVKSRLARGRLRLRARLARRGLAPAATGVAAALSGESRAAVPQELVHSTIRATTLCATGVYPAAVSALTEEVLKMMVMEKLKLVAVGALVAVGLTAGALAQQASKEPLPKSQQPAAGSQQPSEKPSGNPAGDRRWVASLSNGATIEVIGISSYPPGPDTWWRPDGTPLPQPPCDSPRARRARIRVDGDTVFRVVVARLTDIPAGAEHRWGINQSRANSEQTVELGGKPIPGLSETVAVFPGGMKAGTVRFEVAAGPWQTVQTWETSPGGRANRSGPSYIFGEAIATKKGTALPVTHNIPDVSSVRLVAVDLDGKERSAEVRSNTGVGDYHQLVGGFDLPPEQIKEFRVQTRPYKRVELQGVALKPVGSD